MSDVVEEIWTCRQKALRHEQYLRYYAKNGEALKEYARQYRKDHKEDCAARTAAWLTEAMSLTEDAPCHYFKWSEDEDALVMDRSKSITEIALELGRTYSAVHTRRSKLKREAMKNSRGKDV